MMTPMVSLLFAEIVATGATIASPTGFPIVLSSSVNSRRRPCGEDTHADAWAFVVGCTCRRQRDVAGTPRVPLRELGRDVESSRADFEETGVRDEDVSHVRLPRRRRANDGSRAKGRFVRKPRFLLCGAHGLRFLLLSRDFAARRVALVQPDRFRVSRPGEHLETNGSHHHPES
jgi:hypothetical protein